MQYFRFLGLAHGVTGLESKEDDLTGEFDRNRNGKGFKKGGKSAVESCRKTLTDHGRNAPFTIFAPQDRRSG
jgi:hypothetical protein